MISMLLNPRLDSFPLPEHIICVYVCVYVHVCISVIIKTEISLLLLGKSLMKRGLS